MVRAAFWVNHSTLSDISRVGWTMNLACFVKCVYLLVNGLALVPDAFNDGFVDLVDGNLGGSRPHRFWVVSSFLVKCDTQ